MHTANHFARNYTYSFGLPLDGNSKDSPGEPKPTSGEEQQCEGWRPWARTHLLSSSASPAPSAWRRAFQGRSNLNSAGNVVIEKEKRPPEPLSLSFLPFCVDSPGDLKQDVSLFQECCYLGVAGRLQKIWFGLKQHWTLPNGTAGKDYSLVLSLHSLFRSSTYLRCDIFHLIVSS